MASALEFIGDEIRRAREDAGTTQEQLAKELRYTRSQVAMIETGRRTLSPEMANQLDNIFGTDGRFARMRKQLVVPEANPAWFVSWLHYEQEATEINLYEPLVMPGLLQTADYAGALLVDGDRVQARLDRQRVLGHASVTAVVEESVLRRQVGSREVMYEQLMALAETNACVQVIPSGTTMYVAYDGAFALATVHESEMVYLDTAMQGFVLDAPGVVLEARRRWLTLRAEALPERHSRDLIMKVATEWKS